ncbi:MAG: hypothetical protein ACRDP5_18540, partial [Streptosporangiaceae bacterium]
AMSARGVLGLIAVTALMGSAACGSVSAGSAGQSAGQTTSAGASSSGPPATAAGSPAVQSLCATGQGADRVVISRTVPKRQVTLSGATQVQAMLTALCALPAAPSGKQHCLVVSADSVRLVFAAGAQSFPAITVQEVGCQGITGLGAARSWSASSPFGKLLSEAVGGFGKLVPGTHPSSVPTGP